MALQSVMAAAMLAFGVAAAASLVIEYERRDAAVTQQVAAAWAEAAEAARAERRIVRERAKAEDERRRAAIARCMKDRKRQWERARRAERWHRPREPRSCRQLKG